MATVQTLETARECVFEQGDSVFGMAEYVNQFGNKVYFVAMTQSDVDSLENSPNVDPDTIVWHHKYGTWLIDPKS